APYVIERLGAKRAEEGAYVWQKIMKSGGIVSNGTDAPVEDVDPIPNYYATMPAYAAFEENSKGSLKAGKYADITVLSKDILTIPEDQIPTAKVTHTIVGGKVLFKR